MHPLDRLRSEMPPLPGKPKPQPKTKKPRKPAQDRQPLRPPLAVAPVKVRILPALRDDSAGASKLWFDYETFSDIDIKKHGLDNYAKHPTTRPILLAFAFDGHATQLLDLTATTIPAFVLAAFTNPKVTKIAWNIPFERAITQHCLGVTIPLCQVFDPSALARKLTFPGGLSLACQAAGLKEEEGKDKAGNRLIKMFSVPSKNPATKIKQGEPALFRRMPFHNPEDWEQFCTYCVRDVDAMRTLTGILTSLAEWTPEDRELWMLSETINQTGLPVDLTYVTHADRLMRSCDARTLQTLKDKTQCENPNSPKQLKDYCDEQGYHLQSLRADEIDYLLSSDLHDVPEPVTEVLKLRRALSGAAPKKLVAIQNFVSEDLRLRNQYVFHGGRTGRFTGREVQPQNLSKPKPEYEELVPTFTELIRQGKLPEGVSTADAITGTIRSAFRPDDDHKLVIADFASIENRVLAWFASCEGMLDVFKKNLDPYKSFASLVYDKPYEDITKAERTSCKPAVLGSGFGMSAPTLKHYAEGMGISVDDDRAGELIAAFRREYWEVPQFWRNLEQAVKTALTLTEVVEYETAPGITLVIDARDERCMSIQLPSGRLMFYRQACVRETMTAWGEMRPTILYVEPRSAIKKNFSQGDLTGYTLTHGSKLCENVVQAAARDIQTECMLAASKRGYKIIGHCHDEIVLESRNECAEAEMASLLGLMSTPPKWALDLPLGAAGVISQFYIK